MAGHFYYYDSNGYRIGPFDRTELKEHAARGLIQEHTIIEDSRTGTRAIAKNVQGFTFGPVTAVPAPPMPVPSVPPPLTQASTASPVFPSVLPLSSEQTQTQCYSQHLPAIDVFDYRCDYPEHCRVIQGCKRVIIIVYVLAVIVTLIQAGVAAYTEGPIGFFIGLLLGGLINCAIAFLIVCYYRFYIETLTLRIRQEVNTRQQKMG